MSVRPFNDLLREHRNGMTHDELSDALNELVAAVADEKRGGTLTFTVSVKPYGKDGALEVSAETKVKLPKKTPGSSIFYVSPENNLLREDPRQTKMELREAPPTSAARALA
jgi:hypothetical protein